MIEKLNRIELTGPVCIEGDGMTENSSEEAQGSEPAEDDTKVEKDGSETTATATTHNPKTYKTVICQYYLQGKTSTLFRIDVFIFTPGFFIDHFFGSEV